MDHHRSAVLRFRKNLIAEPSTAKTTYTIRFFLWHIRHQLMGHLVGRGSNTFRNQCFRAHFTVRRPYLNVPRCGNRPRAHSGTSRLVYTMYKFGIASSYPVGWYPTVVRHVVIQTSFVFANGRISIFANAS